MNNRHRWGSGNWARLALCMTLAGTMGIAQARTMDLAEAYRTAVGHDPQLSAARSRLEAGKEALPQARALFLPSVQVQAETGYTKEDVDTDNALSTRQVDYPTRSAGVSLIQPLFRKESFSLYRESKVALSQAQLRYGIAQQDLLLRVSEAYFGELGARASVRSYEAELTAIDNQLQRAQKSLDVGSGTITDLNEAQARHDLTQAQLLAARNQLSIAREKLARILGIPTGDLADVRDRFVAQPPTPTDARTWSERAEKNNLQVRQAELALKKAREEITRQDAARYPKVDLVAQYGHQYQGTDMLDPQGHTDAERSSVSLQLSMPLFTGGAVSSRVRQARSEKNAAIDDAMAARQQAGLQAQSAYLSLASSLQQVKALQQALISIKSQEESTRKGLEVGLRTTLDVLNVQRQRFATERDLADAQYNYLLNYLRLQVAVGQGLDGSIIDDVNFFLNKQ